MAVIKGKNGSILIGSNVIGELNSFSVTITQNTEDTFAFGDDWMTSTATSKSWSIEASGYHDPADANGQVALITDILTGDSSISVKLRTEGSTTGDDEYTGTVTLQEVSMEAAADGIVGFSFSGMGSGSLTKGTVA
jgi:hypothetical protein